MRTASVDLPLAFDAAGPRTSGASLDRWWLLFDDSQLNELIEQALAHGFAVREAFARLQEAQAIRASALSHFEVQGQLQASSQIQKTDNFLSTTKTNNVSIPISWELDLFGRRKATSKVADADLAVAGFNYEGVRIIFIANVVTNLFEARGLAAQLDDARASAAIQQRFYGVIKQRAARGLATSDDLDQAESDMAASHAQEVKLDAALNASRRALLTLLGSGSTRLDYLPISTVAFRLPTVPASLPGELLARRPDVREAAARMASATGNVRLAELAYYPTITPQASLAFNAQTGGLGAIGLIGAVGASLVTPIFDRPRLQAELRASGARGEQAVLAYERTVQTAYSEADQALIQLAAARQQIEVLQDGVTLAQRAYDAVLQRYERGLADLPAMLGAERTFRNSRTSLTAAQVAALQVSVTAFKALGGGWTAPPISPSDHQR